MTRESASDEVANASRGDVRLDETGDDVHRRPLRGEHQVDAGRARELRDAHDRVLDVTRGDHHQVGELVDDHEQIRVGLQHPLAALGRLHLAAAHGLVEVVDVPVPVRRQVVVPKIHLSYDPLERLGGPLRVGDDRRDQVRDALVRGELDALGVDKDHADVLGVARTMIEVIKQLMQADLPEPVAPATSTCGIFARLAIT